jgi:transcriptional regulator with XRE-family HTH domain
VTAGADVAERLYRLLGARIRTRRQKLGITQEALAGRIRRTRTSVSNLEAGRQKLPLHQLLLVARALDTDIRDLLPSREELASPERVPVQVGSSKAVVTPATAELIQDILSGSNNATTPRSQRRDQGL